MGTPQTPVAEGATEEVLEDADLIVDDNASELVVVDCDEDDDFDSRETDALPRVDAARALALLGAAHRSWAPAEEPSPLPDATEKVSAESILGVANALLAEPEAPMAADRAEHRGEPPRAAPPRPRGRTALPSSPTPFSVALPLRIETRPLTTGRVETLPEPAELDAWVPPTLPPRSQAIDPAAQLATVPLARYWPLFAAAALMGVALLGVVSLGMRRPATLASAMRADEVMVRAEHEVPPPIEPAGPPRPTKAAKHALPAMRPATVAVTGRAPAVPAPKPSAKKPAAKAAPKVTPKTSPAPRRK